MGDIVITPASNDVNSTAGTLIIRTSDAQAMSLKTSDTDRVYITSAGNVGIGLTNPSEKTQITGNLKISPLSSSWAEGISFSMPQVSTWGGLRWRRERANADGNHYVGYIGSDATDDLVFGSNNAGTQIDNNIRITKAGRVGINTSAPLAILSVGSGSLADGNVPVQISSAGPGTEKWFAANRNGGYGLLLGYYEGSSLAGSGAYVRQVTSDPMHFAVNNTSVAISILSNTNVGIGTTAPAQKLDVNGAIIAGINNSYGAYTRTPGGVLKPWFATSSVNTFFYNTNVSGSIFWQNAADSATLKSLTEQARLGINTADPSGRLHVLDTVLYPPSLTWNATAATIIRSENGQIAFGSDDTSPYGIWQQVRTSSSTARPLLLNPLGGNVGIGLRNPTKKLHVVGSLYWDYNGTSAEEHSVAIQRTVAAANGAYTEIGTLAASASSIRATFEIFHHDSGTIEYSLFELIANYYTGTTTDWVQLPSRTQAHYAGDRNGVVVDARLTTTGGSVELRLRSIGGASAAMTVNVRIKSNTNLTETSATGTGATVAGLLGFNRYEFPVTDNRFKATTEGLFIKNNGFIGIGTTNPIALLELYKIPATSGTLQPMLTITSDYTSAATTNFGSSIVFKGRTAGNLFQDNAQIAAYNENISDNGYALGFYTRPNATDGLQQRLTILRNGNIGIASTNPPVKLDVGGAIRVSGNIISHKTASYTTSYPGINSFGADTTDSSITYYDTGKTVINTDFRGVVWTGKHYIFTTYGNPPNVPRAYFYDNNFNQIKNAYGFNYVELTIPSGYGSPHGAAWDGRYLWVVVYTGSASKIVGYDLDGTSQTATIIAESAALPINSTYDIEYADGHLYLVYSGTLYIYKWNGSSIDLVSTAASAAGTISAQAITYDGSYLWVTSNGANIYKVGLDGTAIATITTFPPNICGWAWNGSNIACFDYNNRNIFIINTTRLRIDTQKLALMGGNVGIGATNPGTKLDIGSTQGGAIQLRYDTSTSYLAQITPYWNSNTDTRIDFAINRIANTTPAVIMSVGYASRVGIGTIAPVSLLDVGGPGSTTAASGLTFGGDAQANLYRAAEDTIKTDGSLNVAGLIYNTNSAYYSSVSKSTTANWGQYTVVLGNASYSSQLIQVSVNGGNLVWAGTFLASCHLSYRPNETWINVKLLECATYNCSNDDVTLLALSNSTTSQYGIPALVLKTNGAISSNYGTGYANTIVVTVNGPSPNEFVLSSSSWTQPYTYQIATSANTKQIYTNEAGNVGVGTTSPVAKLEVAGALRVTGIGQIGPANGYGFGLFNAGTNTFAGQSYGRANGIQFTDNIGGNTVYIASGGNVGIGLTNPSYRLEIAAGSANAVVAKLTQGNERVRYNGFDLLGYNDGNLWMMGNNATSTILISKDWDWDTQIGIAYTPSTVGVAGGSLEIGQLTKNNASFTHGNTRFYTSGVERLRINNIGNVGIGTNNPGATLQVYGGATANNNKSLMAGDNANSLSYVPSTTAGGWNNASVLGGSALFNSLGSTWLIGTHNGPAMRFGTNNISLTNPLGGIDLYVGSGANIGISNTTPKFALHVNGDVTIPNARYLNFNPGELQGTAINRAIVASYSDDTATAQPKQLGIILHNDSNTNDTFSPALVFGSKSNSSNYSQATAVIAGRRRSLVGDVNWHAGELWFWTATSNEASAGVAVGIPTATPAMVINSTRFVGIGASSPGDKLQVNLNSGENILANIIGNGVSANNKVSFRLSELGTPLGEFSAVRDGTNYQVKLQTLVNEPLSFGTSGTTRMVIDGSFVGIGSTTPTALLNVRASVPTSIGATPAGTNLLIDSNTSNYITFRNTADNGTYAGLVFLDNNVGGYIAFRNYTTDGTISGSDSMIYGAYQDHIFQNGYVNDNLYNRTESLRIKQNGYVGINTNNPSARLQVVQSNGGGVAAILLSQDESTIQGPSANTQIRMGSNLVLNASNVIPIATNGTERIRIDVSGNVGIGTAVPYSRLDLQLASAATRYLTLSTNDGQGSFNGFGLNFRIADQGHDIAQIKGEYENSAGGGYGGLFIATRYAGTLYNRLAINDNGRVGIGVSYGTTLLTVGGAGSTTAASGITFGGDASANLYRDSSASIRTDGGFLAAGRIRSLDYIQFNSNLYSNAFTNPIDINVGNVAGNAWLSAIRFNQGGYVGIGTNVPSGKLHVVSSVAGETVLRADGTNGVLFSVVDDLSDSLMSVNNSAGLPVLEVFADDRVVMGQYGSGDFVLRNNKIGLGTSNPANKLSVIGGASIGSTTYNTSAPSNGLIVEGNVGIGTTNPSSKLQVNGEVRIASSSSYFTHLNYLDGGSNLISSTNGGSTLFRGSSNNLTSMVIEGGGTVNTYYNTFLALTNGNVGVGTNAPAVKLDVIGPVGSFPTGAGTITTGVNLRLRNSDSNLVLDIGGNGGNGNWLQSTNRSDLSLTYPLLLNPRGGSVGIGTTSPSTKLEVGYFLDAFTNKITVSCRYENQPEFNFKLGQAGTNFDWIGGVISCGDDGNYNGIINFKTANAGRDTPTTKMVIRANGNVGINITTPTSKLHVVETTPTGSRIQLDTVSANAYMNAGRVNDFLILTAPFNAVPASTSNNNAKWGIKLNGSIDSPNTNSKSAAIYAVSEEDAVGGAGYNRKVGIALHTSAFDLEHTERVRINNVGNVGIGLTNPTQKLEVAGYSMAGAGSYRTSTYADNGGAYLYFGTSAAPTNLGTIGAYGSLFNINSLNGDISFQYNGSEKMRVAQGGTVGIGTASAIGKLDIYDDTNAGHVAFVRNNNTGSSAYSAFVLRRDGNLNGIVLFTNSSNRSTDGGLGNSTIRTDNGKLLLGAGASTYHSLETNGNVGIGLTNPAAARLHVKGDGTNPVLRVETALLVAGTTTASKTFVGWMPIQTGAANPGDTVFIPLFK